MLSVLPEQVPLCGHRLGGQLVQSLGKRVLLLSGRWSLCSGRGQGSAGRGCAEHGDLQVKGGGNVEVQYPCGLGLDGEGVRGAGGDAHELAPGSGDDLVPELEGHLAVEDVEDFLALVVHVRGRGRPWPA